MKPVIDVAIGLVFSQAKVLVGWREAKQHQGNKYEFPGGKVEQGETPVQACRREILEEVGVDIQTWHPFQLIQHDYEDLEVRLHIFFAQLEQNQMQQVKQQWQWYTRVELLTLNFPKANVDILKRLYWAPYLKISPKLSELTDQADDRLFYFRPEQWTEQQMQAVRELSVAQQAQLILNENDWKTLDQSTIKIAAVHLKQSQLMQKDVGDLMIGQRYIAACHDLESLQHAQHIGCEAVLLSPVLATPSHPNDMPLGWQQAQAWIETVDIPVFALGGMQPAFLQQAAQYGFYGLAGISNF